MTFFDEELVLMVRSGIEQTGVCFADWPDRTSSSSLRRRQDPMEAIQSNYYQL